MKYIYALICLLLASTANAITYSDEVRNLKWNDPIEISEDGETWYPAHFLMYYKTKGCRPVPDDENGNPQPSDCTIESEHLRYVYYEKPEHPDDFKVHYIRPASNPTDHEPPPYPDLEPVEDGPSKAELYGLLTRIENLINSTDPRAAFSTATGMMADKESLQPRIDALREILKNE